MRTRNSRAHLILCSYGTELETSLFSFGHNYWLIDIPIAEEVEEKEKLKNLLKWGKW